MMRRFGWIVLALGMTAFGTASATDPAPARTRATPAEIAPEYGGCIWECEDTGARYRTRAACTAACSGFCEPIC
jgi:hypothetical protein